MLHIRAFLCYSSLDKQIVMKVKTALDKRGIFTWFDEFQVGVGESIRREIEKGIKSSNFLILFMSKSAFKSEWVNREFDAAFTEEIESKNTTIIPILIEDCEIPITLKSRRYIDLRQDHEKGISALIDSLVYPRRKVLHALVGRWVGNSGTLYLSSVGNLIIGKYDWKDQKSGNIFGHVEKNRVKFNWNWDHSKEHGMGVFELCNELNTLKGGWWFSTVDLDPDQDFKVLSLIEGFNQWDFEKDQGGKEDTSADYCGGILDNIGVALYKTDIRHTHINSLNPAFLRIFDAPELSKKQFIPRIGNKLKTVTKFLRAKTSKKSKTPREFKRRNR